MVSEVAGVISPSDYSEELHWLIKNYSPRQGYLRQRLVCWTRWKNFFFFNVSSWSSSLVKFLVRGFEVAQEIQPS